MKTKQAPAEMAGVCFGAMRAIFSSRIKLNSACRMCEKGMTLRVLVAKLNVAMTLVASVSLSGCLSNRAETLAPDMIRLHFPGGDAPNDLESTKAVIRAAAEETLSHGYQLFRLLEWSADGASTGLIPTVGAVPGFSIVVKMFLDGQQGSNPVFDARNILNESAKAQAAEAN